MARENHHVRGKPPEPLDRVEHHSGQVELAERLGCGGRQVGPADVAQKQGVSAEHGPDLVPGQVGFVVGGGRVLGEQNAGRLEGVAGRVPEVQVDRAELDAVVVFHVENLLVTRPRAVTFGSASSVGPM